MQYRLPLTARTGMLVMICCLVVQTSIAQDPMRVERIRVIPEDFPVLNIHVDDENVKWVANTEGLYRVDAKDMATRVPIASGEVSLLQFPGGNADIRWSESVIESLLGPAKITAAAYDNGQKVLWIGTNGYGVFKFKTDPDLRLIEQLHIDNSKLRSDFINSIFVARSGKIWIATEDGAVTIKGSVWTHHQKFFNILRIRGRGNELWAIGDDLIWIIDNKDNWTPIEINRRQIEAEIHDIAVDKEGRIWIASNIMTSYRVVNDRYQRFGPGQYFTSQFVNYVSVDDDGTIWVGTNDKGLYIIIKESTITVTSKIEKYLDCNAPSNDASLSVRAIGGKPPYQFVWGHGASGDRISGLGPGKYQLTVTDTEGSSKTETVEIPDPFMTATAVMEKPESDAGMEDGAASVTVSGGAPPYSYEWFSGIGEAVMSGLSEGSYGITITDAAGCSVITSVAITQIVKPLSVTLEQKEYIRCAGGTDAVVAAQTVGGKAPYIFSWSSGTDEGPFREHLAAGTYSVTVTDMLGSSATATITVPEPQAMMATIHIDRPASTNANDGAAMVRCTGGQPPYQYNWDNGEVTPSAVSLAPRRHRVTVTDASGCTSLAAVDIVENVLPFSASLRQTAENRCAGDKTAALTVDVTGGKSPFTFRWDRPGLNGSEAMGLPAGSYAVTVSDAAGNSVGLTASIAEPRPVQASTLAETPALSGKNEGHAIIRAEGGTGKLTFRWDNGDTGNKTESLSAGVHTVTVTDAAGCTLVASVEIVEDFLPLGVLLEQQGGISCHGSKEAAVQALVTGGKTPYQLTWTNGIPEGTMHPQNLGAGTYALLVTDAEGNTARKEITVREPDPLEVNAEVLGPASANNADGMAEVVVRGGSGPYGIRWTNGESTARVTTLAAGTYGVTVTDANGCEAVREIHVTEDILPLQVKLTQTGQIRCAGVPGGSVTASLSGGKAPFTMRWSDGEDSPERSGLPAGTYQVSVSDASGQQVSAEISITQPEPLSGEMTDVRAATHARIQDGKATARISGGTTPYHFAWDNGEASARATGLSAGDHVVSVTDAHDCTIVLSVQISEKILPELTAGNLEKGEAVRMEKLLFEADSSSIDASSIPTLEELYQFLYDNPTIVVEIGGHTNGLPEHDYCDKLSTERAKAVSDYIVDKGIDPKRILFKGYGKRQPIATNMTPEGRRRNQRVEVRIVRLSE